MSVEPTSLKNPGARAGLPAFLGGCRRLGAGVRRALCAAGVALLTAYFIFCALFLALRYLVLPNIGLYKDDIEKMATHAVGRKVAIRTIDASWHGLRPHLKLGDVRIFDKEGGQALSLPEVSATVSWWSFAALDLRLESLQISRPDMDIERDRQGNFYIAGILVDRRQDDKGQGLDWVLSQREIVIRDGWIRWRDEMRGAPELALSGVDFVLRNQWRHHRVALRATPPHEMASPIDVRADFVHPVFSRRISDFSQWKGTLYADWRNTDLAVWKAYFDYPFEIQKGKGSVRAWLNMDHARIADFTADLTLAGVSTRLRKDLQQLNLARVSGRISVSEGVGKTQLLSFGSRGHEMSVSDLSFETAEGLKLTPTTITQTVIAASKDLPEKTVINAKSLDLHILGEFIEHLPLTATQRKMLDDFAPRGQLKDFSAEWQGVYPDISSYRVKGGFIGLGLNAQPPRPARPRQGKLPAQAGVPGIPGFSNLSGRIDASADGGMFALDSKDLVLNLPGYFAQPAMPFEKLAMQAKWDLRDKAGLQFQIDSMRFVQDGVSGSLSGRHTMPLVTNQGKPLGTVDLTAKIDSIDLDKVGRYLPTSAHENLKNWLSGSLLGGQAKDVAVAIRGDVADIPFHPKSPGEKPKGHFAISGKIENGRMDYAPGHFAPDGQSPVWPFLEQVQGHFTVENARLHIHGDKAVTRNVAIADVDAVIGNLLAEDNVLEIEGTASGTLQDFLGYVNHSPVAEWMAHFTEETKATGNAKLALKLELPLHRMEQAKVQGSIKFGGNNVVLQDLMPMITGAGGELAFSEKGFALNGIKGSFLGGMASVTGGTQRNGEIGVRVDGNMTAEGLRKAYAMPAMQRLMQNVSGGTRYSAAINIRKKRPEIVVESSLHGIGLNFPAPLRKAASEALPLRFELIGMPSNDALKLQDEIRVSLGSAISARYAREKLIDKESSWQLVQGGIGINAPPPQPDTGLVANVSLKSLDIDAWRNAVAGIVGGGGNGGNNDRSAVPETASRDASGNDGRGGKDIGISQYIEPDALAARADALYVMGKKLDNVVVGASHQKGSWQANIDSEQASGYVSWDESPSGRGLGRVRARLASLIIPQSVASDVSELLEGKSSAATQLPGLDIVAENFQLFGKQLGQLELIANNAMGANGREWRIGKLWLSNQDATFKAAGRWMPGADASANSTNLTYALDIADAGRLLNRFGFANVLRGGKGKLDGDISWKGLPFSIDIPTLSGQVHLDMAAGQFLKVDPGAAKLLGVLSLQSLPRRLTLDFRDIFSEGFAFDGVVGTAKIAQGVMTTDNFKMRSVNAVVLMDGSVNIAQEAQDLHVVVIPEINAGAASVVYGLVVNPVIGLGSFLAQLFLRDPLMRAFTMEYQITGPWKDPEINKLPRNIGQAVRGVPHAARRSSVLYQDRG